APSPMETVLEVLHREAVSPRLLQPSVPRDLETICLRCLAKEPGRRYPSALALADDLRHFCQGEPIRARPVGEWERVLKWAWRRPAVAALLAAVVLLLLGGTVVSTFFAVQADRGERTAQQAQGLAEIKELEARAAQASAEAEKLRARQQAAELLLTKGLAEAGTGVIDKALDTMLRALDEAPPEATPFRRLVCLNLAAWSSNAPAVGQTLPSAGIPRF